MIRAWILFGAFLLGRVDVGLGLVRVCERESRCSLVGVHARDAHLSGLGYRGQVRLEHLAPACQRPGPGWATRGIFGLSAASHWRYLPACYQPELLDVAAVSFAVAFSKYVRHCTGGGRRRLWCA